MGDIILSRPVWGRVIKLLSVIRGDGGWGIGVYVYYGINDGGVNNTGHSMVMAFKMICGKFADTAAAAATTRS